MTALDCYENIINNDNLLNYPFKYCLVDNNKIPLKINGEIVKPNNVEDFVDLFDLYTDNLEEFKGIGISIQGSHICAIDIDHCFKKPFNFSTMDDRGKAIFLKFQNSAYIEYSFSGTGLRILFNHPPIENYKEKYYIKNSKINVEFYLPNESYRYVTLTGKYIINNKIKDISKNPYWEKAFFEFLNEFMLRPYPKENIENKDEIISDERDIKELKKEIKKLYLINQEFQDLWFGIAPGSNSNESELDYRLLKLLYINITQDKNRLIELFELSPYFSTKDKNHLKKWKYGNYRYFEYMFSHF